MSAGPAVVLPRMPPMRLDGRRALVTGAGRGLGVACAAVLAQAGAHVTLMARTASETEAVAAAIVAEGGAAATMTGDVCDVAAATAAIAAAIGEAGPFDILVNNAGTNRPGPFLDVTPDAYDTVMDLNLRAAFFVAQAVARGLVAAGRPGSIIHMSSQMGHVGGPRRTIYCASKHGLEGLSKAMAVELGPLGIRVNTVCPTFVETPMTRPYFEDPAFRGDVLARIKLGRLGQPEDLMGAVLFLASDASAMVTGTALVVDGGWTAE